MCNSVIKAVGQPACQAPPCGVEHRLPGRPDFNGDRPIALVKKTYNVPVIRRRKSRTFVELRGAGVVPRGVSSLHARVPRSALWPLLAVPLLMSGGCELMVAGPRASASDVWERTYALGNTPSVSIRNTNGSLTVQVHDAPRIDVRAERSVQAATEQGARELLAQTTIGEDITATSVSLSTRRPSSFGLGQQAQVRYDVRVPRGTSLALRTTNGALSIEGVQGVIELETVNGRVRGTGLGQVHRAETVNGSVELGLDRVSPRGATFETVNGSVEVTLPASTAAAVSVRTVNGSIAVTGFTRVDEGERQRRRYEGTVNGGGPALRIETVNGSVSVRGQEPGTN